MSALLRVANLDTLDADLFVAGTFLPTDCVSDGSAASGRDCGWRNLQALRPFTRRSLAPMLTQLQLHSAVEAMPSWPNISAAFAQTRYPRFRDLSIWSPVLGSASASVLRELHDCQRVLELLLKHERWRGRNYTRIVWSRLEMEWLAPHPPLHKLPREALWMPWMPFGGLNDHHAVMSREHADIYLGRWQLLLSGGCSPPWPA